MRVIRPSAGFVALTTQEYMLSSIDDCRLVCLTSRDVTILRKGLEPLYWGTRYGEWLSPSEFELSDNSGLVETLEELEVKLMGCNDGLNAIAKAIELLAKSQCCDTTAIVVNVNAGVNGSLSDGTITYGTEPYSETEVTLPDGYESIAQYRAQKCAIANAMADGIFLVLYGIDGITAFNAIASTVVLILGAAAIIAVPPVIVPTMVAAICVAWLVTGAFFVLAQELEAYRGDIVCALYNSESPAVAISLVADIFDVAIAAIAVSSPVGLALKTVLMTLVNEDTLSQLYEEYAGFMYPAADCGDCLGDCGEQGEWVHLSAFSAVSDGYTIESEGEFGIVGSVDQGGDVGYRYSAFFGETWGVYPTNARMVTSIDCSPGLDGTTEHGYVVVYGSNGLPLFGGGFGYDDLGDVNELIGDGVCVSAVAFAYADVSSSVTIQVLW